MTTLVAKHKKNKGIGFNNNNKETRMNEEREELIGIP